MNLFRLPQILLVAYATLPVFPISILHAQTIPKGNLTVDLETFATLPRSNNEPARVNVFRPDPAGRIFTNDQRGLLYSISSDGAVVTLFLDLTKYIPLLADDGERGFQCFAFHPDFYQAGAAGYGKFYTMASQSDTDATATFSPGVSGAGRDHDEVLLEWTVRDPAATVFAPADPGHPFREVLRIARPNSNHNAGYLSFNPVATRADYGNLYLGTGDSGGGGDPFQLAQSPGKVYGAILRINPLLPASTDPNRSANGQYRIPADNPFATNPSFLKEKYLMGFRNPQRFTWDRTNGRMFVADIGQNSVEEIDVAKAGANYGWNAREGSYVFNSDGSIGANVRGDAASTGYTYPIAEYMHYSPAGNAVTTGPVYRGSIIPALAGRLLFGDFVNGVPYTLDADNLPDGGQGGITELRLRVNGSEMSFLSIIQQVNPSATRADLRFGTDAADNVYFLDKHDGIIRRVATTAAVSVRINKTTISRLAGQAAKIIFTREGGDLSSALKIDYVLRGSLENGTDYEALSGREKIKPGLTRAVERIVPIKGGATGKIKLKVTGTDGHKVSPPLKAVLQITD